jgi:hypothetical protein
MKSNPIQVKKYQRLTLLDDHDTFGGASTVLLVPESELKDGEIGDCLIAEIPEEDGINTREVDVRQLNGTIEIDVDVMIEMWEYFQKHPTRNRKLASILKRMHVRYTDK